MTTTHQSRNTGLLHDETHAHTTRHASVLEDVPVTLYKEYNFPNKFTDLVLYPFYLFRSIQLLWDARSCAKYTPDCLVRAFANQNEPSWDSALGASASPPQCPRPLFLLGILSLVSLLNLLLVRVSTVLPSIQNVVATLTCSTQFISRLSIFALRVTPITYSTHSTPQQ